MAVQDTLILVDDDADIRELLSAALEVEGFAVRACADTEAMDAALAQGPVDLILMDLMMPGEDGISATRRLRLSSDTPIIMLTAKGDDLDRIIGLEIGADDYVPKPFNTRELIARIRAVLRRSRHVKAESSASAQEILAFDRWRVDMMTRELRDEMGSLCNLTSGEFELLKIFIQSPGEVLTREDLLQQTKGRQLHALDRSIDIQISRLRTKIEENPKKPKLIKTVRSSGYTLAAQFSRV